MGALDAELDAGFGEAGDAALPASSPTPSTLVAAARPLALIEVIDRDGTSRQSLAVHRWPVTIGRALDNDLVLGDPHVAAHHLRLAPSADAPGRLELAVGATRNGIAVGRQQVGGGGRSVLAAAGADAHEIGIGRTLLRVRLADQPVADELPLASSAGPLRPLALLALAAVVLGELLAVTWLDTDRDSFTRAAATALLSGVGGAGIWCGAWALLSKTFGRQARFGWHLRVFLVASVAMLLVSTLPELLAFAFSWPWASSFDFIPKIGVAAGALYFHLLAVEANRPRALRAAAAAFALVGVSIAVWFNVQRLDRFGDELYMSHLFPPSLRLARPVPVERLVDRLATLKEPLDRKAREAGDAGEADDKGGTSDER